MSIREKILSMSYREEKPGVWAKPVGYHLFSFDETKMEWTNWFKDVRDEISVFERKSIPIQGFIEYLKMYEAFARTNCGIGNSEFQLSGVDL